MIAVWTMNGNDGGDLSKLPEFIDQFTDVLNVPPDIGTTLIVPGARPNALFIKHYLKI